MTVGQRVKIQFDFQVRAFGRPVADQNQFVIADLLEALVLHSRMMLIEVSQGPSSGKSASP